jgi:hypothetical protein
LFVRVAKIPSIEKERPKAPPSILQRNMALELDCFDDQITASAVQRMALPAATCWVTLQ